MQVERIIERDSKTKEEANRRLDSQMPNDKRAKYDNILSVTKKHGTVFLYSMASSIFKNIFSSYSAFVAHFKYGFFVGVFSLLNSAQKISSIA